MSTIRRSATVIALGALLLLFATPTLAASFPDASTPGPSFDFLSWVEEAWSGLTSLWGADGVGMDPNGGNSIDTDPDSGSQDLRLERPETERSAPGRTLEGVHRTT